MLAPLTCLALVTLSGWQPPGTRSFAAVFAVDPTAHQARLVGSVRLAGLSQGEAARAMSRVRVNAWPAGRSQTGAIGVSDNSMDVATPSTSGQYSLTTMGPQELCWVEATAQGFEPAGVVVPGTATVDFTLFPADPPR